MPAENLLSHSLQVKHKLSLSTCVLAIASWLGLQLGLVFLQLESQLQQNIYGIRNEIQMLRTLGTLRAYSQFLQHIYDLS